MRHNKWISAMTAGVLILLLCLTLVLTTSPKVSAADMTKTKALAFNQSVSGCIYGMDSAIYPYTCTMVINNVNNPNLEGEYEIVCCYMDLRNDGSVPNMDFGLIECYTEAVFYYPELDQYEKWTDLESIPAESHSLTPLFVGVGSMLVDDVNYYGYLVDITSVFMIDSQNVATLTWQREQ